MSTRFLKADNIHLVRCRSRARAASYATRDTIRDLMGQRRQRAELRKYEFVALDKVSLTLRPGDTVGIIGSNGAGKSTLLKVLAGVIEPSAGAVSRAGQVEAVMGLGAELNPHLTGRENLAFGAMLRGFRGLDEERYCDMVTEFADLGETLDAPTETYSDGMRARLSFAMAAMAEPDFLLVDEALSVGDMQFQRKCSHFIEDYVRSGGALLFVSHNQLQVQSLCKRAIWIEDGRIASDGNAVDVMRAMVDHNNRGPIEEEIPNYGSLRLIRFGLADGVARTGEPADLVVGYSLDEHHEGISWGFEIWTTDNTICVTSDQHLGTRDLEAGDGELRCRIKNLSITPGTYRLKANVVDRVSGLPIAIVGFGGVDVMVKIESEPSILSNRQIETQQIMVVDTEWF